MKAVALFDPHSGGHHEWYLRVFAEELAAGSWNVILIAPSAEQVATRASVESLKVDAASPVVHGFRWQPEPSEFRENWVAGRKQLWASAYAALLAAEARFELRVSICFFCWMDSWLGRGQRRGAVERAFPRLFSGLVFQPWMYRVRGRAPGLRRSVLNPHEPLHASNCRTIAILDPHVARPFEKDIRRPVLVLPDVPCVEMAEPSPLGERLTERAAGRSTVLLAGSIDRRKGLDAFLRAAAAADAREWLFVIAGPIAWHTLRESETLSLRKLMASPTSAAEVIFTDVLSEADLNAMLLKSSLIWLCYEDFCFSSNLLSKAATFAIPVLSNDEHLIGEMVGKYSLGFLHSRERPFRFTQQGREILQAFSRSPEFRSGAATFARLHSRAVLARGLRGVLNGGGYGRTDAARR